MDYTAIQTGDMRQHIKNRIRSLEEVHYSNVVSMILMEKAGKTKEETFQQLQASNKSAESIIKHLNELLEDLPEEVTEEPIEEPELTATESVPGAPTLDDEGN